MIGYEEKIWEATQKLMEEDIRVLQFFLFGMDEESHVIELLRLMNPPEGAKIVDAGCGIGEIAKIMQNHRPDLEFTLINRNRKQLDASPEGMDKICVDMHDTGLKSGVYDVIMINYALGYADMEKIFKESHRLLKDEGVLFICDMEGKSPLMNPVLDYNTYTTQEIVDFAKGFYLDFHDSPQNICFRNLNKILERETPEAGKLLIHALKDIKPSVWRFINKHKGGC